MECFEEFLPPPEDIDDQRYLRRESALYVLATLAQILIKANTQKPEKK